MDPRLALYYMVAASGVIMIVGGMWLIYKEKIFIDRESNQPIEVQSPLGSFKSNYPALTLFVIGFFPLVYPIYSINSLEGFVRVQTVHIKGPVQASAYPVLVYAARAQDAVSKEGEFRVPVPYLLGDRYDNDYRILLVVNGHVIDEARAVRTPNADAIEIRFKPVAVEAPSYVPSVAPVPEAYR
jgi:hypothetical protein